MGIVNKRPDPNIPRTYQEVMSGPRTIEATTKITSSCSLTAAGTTVSPAAAEQPEMMEDVVLAEGVLKLELTEGEFVEVPEYFPPKITSIAKQLAVNKPFLPVIVKDGLAIHPMQEEERTLQAAREILTKYEATWQQIEWRHYG